MSNVGRHLQHGLRFGATFATFALLLELLKATGLGAAPVAWRAELRGAAVFFAVAVLGGTVYSAARAATGRLRAGALAGACAGPTAVALGGLGADVPVGSLLAAAAVFLPVGAVCGLVLAALYGAREPRARRAPQRGAA